MTSDQSWKEKYLQELESADRREKQWKVERNSLERMLVRTSLASEGQAPELDRLLAQLRKDLRKKELDVDAWRALQEQIDQQVALLDERVPTAVGGAGVVGSATQGQAFSDNMPEAAGVPGDARDITDNTNRLRIARRIGQLLGQLLNQVTLESNAEARARRLQQSLLSSNDWEELREGLNQVAELVIAAITRSQKEFEAFLKRVDERLQQLRGHFAEQSSAQADRLSASEALDREIREELERAGNQVRDSEDLHELKSSVSQHLRSIGQALGRFRDQESEREKVLAEQLEVMQEKIAAMEAHSEQLQSDVKRERQRALTDLLTQLPNREAWQERLAFEFNRWRRYQGPLTVGVLDIDFFKRINDSYGHKAGDRVLQLISRELRERLRATDFIARFGGEEFMVLFPETTPDAAKLAMEKLRQHIGTLPFHFSGEPVLITFSAGLAAFRPGDTEEAVMDRADRALYQAKDDGRNRLVVNEESCDQ